VFRLQLRQKKKKRGVNSWYSTR